MRLGDYLNKLAWSQADLARHAKVSVSTVARVLRSETISRRNAQAICSALSEALHRPIETTDINELHISDYQRPTKKRKGWLQAK